MLKQSYPKIGIRPTIDGRRRGVRESLEEQTMNMAKHVAQFISENLKYPNGEPIQCVISDETIGGVAEAARSKEKFDKEKVCGTLTVTPCWCYGSETMDMAKDIPHAIWGFNGTERPGAVYLASVLATHSQKGIPAFGIYGKDVQEADDNEIPAEVKKKILLFAKGTVAVGIMRDKSYLSMGNVAMGIGGCMIDTNFFEDYLGMRNEYIDMSEFVRRFDEKIYDPAEFEKALKWVDENLHFGRDVYNKPENQPSKEKSREQLETCVKMSIIAKDLMEGNDRLAELGFREEAEGHNAIASGFQGQRQWTDHFPNGDFMEAFSNSQYDWNGLHAPRLMATENDALNGISMLFNYLLTNTPQMFHDVRTYWSPEAFERVTGEKLTGEAANGFLHLSNSGSCTMDATGLQKVNGKPAIKPYYEMTEAEGKANIDDASFIPANVEYFRGGGFSDKFLTRGGMPVTMSRLNMVKGRGPVLQIAEGYSIELSEKANKIIDDRTDPGWPTTFFAPILTGKGAFRSVYDVMNNWGANHGAISYGHIGAELITLASMLRIPVNMHNVDKEKIFRPRTWSLYGTESLESADYLACSDLGPVYK